MELDNLSSVFGGKVPGLNAPLRFKDAASIEKTAMKDVIKQPEKVGWERMAMQGNLNLFGDKDKDKTLNIFDCSPLDRMKQAAVHKLGSDIQPPERPPGTWEKFKAGAGRVAAATVEFGKEKGEEWKKAREAELVHRRAVELERAKVGPPKTAPAPTGYRYRQPYSRYGPLGGPLQVTTSSLSQFGQDLRGGIVAAPISEGYKISSLIGLQPSGGRGAYEALGISPPQPAMPMAPVQQPGVQPQFDPGQLKYSPYSKRPVTYTRGPYRKKRIVVPPEYGAQQQAYY